MNFSVSYRNAEGATIRHDTVEGSDMLHVGKAVFNRDDPVLPPGTVEIDIREIVPA